MELSPEFKKMIEEGKVKVHPKTGRTVVLIGGQSAHIDDAVRAAINKRSRVVATALPEATYMHIEDRLDLTIPPVNGKKVKHVFIEATFPELKGGASRQSAHGEASGTKPAIARAFKNLLKTIPKKRISVISAKISITTKIVEDSSV
jgi:hypothetical protein